LILVVLFGATMGLFVPFGTLHDAVAAELGSFTGSWIADGSKDSWPFGAGREVALFRLTGHVNLKNQIGKENDYWSECLGLVDTENKSDVRCIWKSLDGQKIFLVLQGEILEEGSSMTGTIVGGTGEVAGISGTVNIIWSSMSAHSVNDKTVISGYARGLSGTYSIP
jgi:hypothetical protein